MKEVSLLAINVCLETKSWEKLRGGKVRRGGGSTILQVIRLEFWHLGKALKQSTL